MLDFFLEHFFEILTVMFVSVSIACWHWGNLLQKKHWEQSGREPDERQ